MKNYSLTISVVIPVYNAGKYLLRTLGSVLEQSYSDYEIVLVDDGSTDNSCEICEKFVQQHSNISLYKQENTGCAGARKLGADKAIGEFLFFLDADDTLHKDCLKILYETHLRTKADLVVGYFVRQNEAGEVLEVKSSFRTGEFWDGKVNISLKGKENITDLALKSWRFSGDGLFSSLVCRLFKREYFLEVRAQLQDGITTGEDFLLNIKFLSQLNHIEIINIPLYFYTIRDSATSLSCGLLNKPDYLRIFEVMQEGIAGLLMNNLKMNQSEASAQAYQAVSYQLIGNFIYNFKFYSDSNCKTFDKKVVEFLNSKFVGNVVKHHKVLEGYSSLIPFLMRMKWARVLIFICARRAKKRYR